MTKIRNLLIGFCLITFLLATMMSAARAQIGDLPELPENVNIDTSLEFESDGSFHFTVSAEGAMPGEEIEQLPVSAVDLNIKISSPTSGQLEIELDGSATFTEYGLAELPLENLSIMTPELLNLMLQEFKGKSLSEIPSGIAGEGIELPPEIENLKIESANFMEFSWDEPTLKMGLTATISDSMFEDEELRAELPVTINLSFEENESSLSITIGASSGWAEFDMSLSLTFIDNIWEMSLSMEASGTLPEFEEEGLGYFEIPPEAQKLLEEQDLSEVLEGQNMTFKLTVPEGTDVSGLPGGYDYSDGTYTWAGGNAVSALESIITGAGAEVGPSGEEELPWLWIGIGVIVAIVAITAVAVVRR